MYDGHSEACVAQAIPDVLLSAFEDNGAFKDTKLDKYVPTRKATFIINTNIGADLVLRRRAELQSRAHELTTKDTLVEEIHAEIMQHLKDLPAQVRAFSCVDSLIFCMYACLCLLYTCAGVCGCVFHAT